MIELRGSTWDHTRGYAPLPVTADAYSVTHPDVHITWEKRTLRDFAEMSLPELAKRYDLIVLDHPWIGACVTAGSLQPLDTYLSADFLADQAHNSVGKSYSSYTFDDHQWALAVDAASQVSAYRPDLIDVSELPQTWDQVIALGQRLQRDAHWTISTPLMHVDCFPSFFSLCASLGEPAFMDEIAVVRRSIGHQVLDLMQSLAAISHPDALHMNPPQLLDRMSSTDEIAYSPLLFGYSNYAQAGYRDHRIRFTTIPSIKGAILGGAGMAISSTCQHPAIAADYAAFVASANVQRGMYFDQGGQPGYRGAWLDNRVNEASNDFFRATLPTLDGAAMRPRYDGWITVQDTVCTILHNFLLEKSDPDRVLDQIDAIYRQSLTKRESA
ncbi:MAG TPA: extracellular solute-binding protein [Phototrophicaceae bacterium]|nr:extracellular solute-binding protein [Phototrophicaceae bacterium]